jgi:FlaA1/EpsC-like NDP-sugar epimerase/lipopolysaccharide/colanic/teichoic acid biosynthesis glycosyltransferase
MAHSISTHGHLPRMDPLVAPHRGLMRQLFDRAAAGVGLLILSPLFLAIAALIKLDSRGPVFFRQQRVGRNFRPFDIWKFRTMAEDAPARGGCLTVGDDPRVTRAGRFLRRTKLDELPQLINVLTGEMSLVGPRPEVRKYVDLFVDEYRELLQAPPGVTDLAAIAYRDEASSLGGVTDPEREYITQALPHKLRLSRTSMERSSWWFDLGIIATTLFDVGRDWMLGLGGRPAAPKPFVPRLRAIVLRYRRILVIAFQLGLAALANYAAFLLRFDGAIPAPEYNLFLRTLPWLLVVRSVAFGLFHVNEGLWRYSSLWDLRCIVTAVAASTPVWYALVHGVWGIHAYPRSIFIIDALLLIFFLGGVRLVRRMVPQAVLRRGGRRVLIVGAGDLGEMIVRDMKWHAGDRYEPVGFVDEDGSQRGQYIHGVPVLGSWNELPSIVSTAHPHEVLIATPAIGPAELRRLLMLLEPFPVSITRAPALDMARGHVAVADIRSLAVEDLLERAPVGLDPGAVRALLTGRRVLVTGAGGSIGSELCAQVAALNPAELVLYERYENNLYSVVNSLNDRGFSAGIHPVLGDVTDERRLNAVLAQTKPHVIFHAAAHKHVPLMEANPCEAVKNNVTGTRLVAEAAARHAAERMILISSDKAVNPTSVMGATKSVAEMILSELSMAGTTRFATVRFGNVLGSSGSVVPRFLDQIRAGGPVTVTHPEIQRYFMLISEAVELVLHAAALAHPGSIYVLDMGEQIRLVDLARSLIRLAGFVPDQDIEIVFTGLRPGEKLSEELFGLDEDRLASMVPKILRIQRRTRLGMRAGLGEIARLEQCAIRGDEAAVLEQLRVVVPTFHSRPTTDTAVPARGRLEQPAYLTMTVPPRAGRQDLHGSSIAPPH